MLYVYKNSVYFCILNMYALKIRSTLGIFMTWSKKSLKNQMIYRNEILLGD